jgi:hypothetical protein
MLKEYLFSVCSCNFIQLQSEEIMFDFSSSRKVKELFENRLKAKLGM